MRRSQGEIICRLSTIALLSALGFVLMAFVRFPYPLAPWLMIEFSEVTVLLAYALYGFTGGISVAIIKTALDLAVHGLTDGLGIGHITALLTSLLFVLGLFFTSHVLHWFKKGLLFRILSYVCIALFVSFVMTSLNAIFITPSYLSAFGESSHFSTCFQEGVIKDVLVYLKGKDATIGVMPYIGCIFGIYFPFNLLKSGLCFLIYELLFNRLIFVLMQRSPLMKKYFIGSIFKKDDDKDDDKKEI